MKTAISILLAGFSLVAQGLAQAEAPERSEELKVLERFIGTWDIELTLTPPNGNERVISSFSKRSWSLGGNFVRFEEPANDVRAELQMLLTYDPKTKTYPGILMIGPSRSGVECTWDEATETMHYKVTYSNGHTFTGKSRLTGKNTAEPSGVIKTAEGEEILKLAWKQTRRKNPDVASLEPDKAPEFTALDRFTGTWDVEVRAKAAGTEEESFAADTISHRAWSFGGTFGRFENSSPENAKQQEFQLLLTYDPESRTYPGMMMSGASVSEITGTWKEETEAMAFDATFEGGSTLESVHRFTGKNKAEPSGVIKNADGEIIMDISWNQKRRKAEKKQ